MSAPSTRRRPRRAGYTIIEVMMALGVLGVGAVGLMSLQQATTRGNMQARQMTVATEVARSWAERLRRDAVRWNQQGLPGVQALPGGPVYLRNVPAAPGAPGPWFSPQSNAGDPLESYGADWWGRDTLAPADMVYCTHVRLRWASPQQTIRADVRTFFHKRGDVRDGATNFTLFPNCAAGAEANVTANLALPAPAVRAVFTSLVVRWTPLNP